jgi:hypothetical protein
MEEEGPGERKRGSKRIRKKRERAPKLSPPLRRLLEAEGKSAALAPRQTERQQKRGRKESEFWFPLTR